MQQILPAADWALARRAGWSGVQVDTTSNVEVGQTTYPVNTEK